MSIVNIDAGSLSRMLCVMTQESTKYLSTSVRITFLKVEVIRYDFLGEVLLKLDSEELVGAS